MRTFTLPNDYTIECKSEKTRYGFRHLASLRLNGLEVARTKPATTTALGSGTLSSP